MSVVSSYTLKDGNFKWLCSLVGFDVLLIGALLFPGEVALDDGLLVSRGIAAIAIPIVVLILAGLLSSNFKAVLVYWRLRDVLPGHRAFTKYALQDPRIDLKTLAGNIGSLPIIPRDQNVLWYRLYRKVAESAPVADAHKAFLLYRDMAGMSFLLTVLCPPVLAFAGVELSVVMSTLGLLLLQYLLTALAARTGGIRMVSNVLAIYSGID